MVVQITHIIIRVLLFPPCGILTRPMQITNMSFGLYNPDNLYAFQNIKSGQLRGTKGTSPPPKKKKFRTPQILSKFGVFLLKSTAFQTLSSIMEWLICPIFFLNSGLEQSGLRFPD